MILTPVSKLRVQSAAALTYAGRLLSADYASERGNLQAAQSTNGLVTGVHLGSHPQLRCYLGNREPVQICTARSEVFQNNGSNYTCMMAHALRKSAQWQQTRQCSAVSAKISGTSCAEYARPRILLVCARVFVFVRPRHQQPDC